MWFLIGLVVVVFLGSLIVKAVTAANPDADAGTVGALVAGGFGLLLAVIFLVTAIK